MFIVEEYDMEALYPMLLKCYHYLHPAGKSEFGGVVDHKVDDCKLNIFQMTISNNEPTKELVIKKLNFRRFHVDVKDIKSLVIVGKPSFSSSNCRVCSKANTWHCRFSNRDGTYFFACYNFNKPQKMLFVIRKFKEAYFC